MDLTGNVTIYCKPRARHVNLWLTDGRLTAWGGRGWHAAKPTQVDQPKTPIVELIRNRVRGGYEFLGVLPQAALQAEVSTVDAHELVDVLALDIMRTWRHTQSLTLPEPCHFGTLLLHAALIHLRTADDPLLPRALTAHSLAAQAATLNVRRDRLQQQLTEIEHSVLMQVAWLRQHNDNDEVLRLAQALRASNQGSLVALGQHLVLEAMHTSGAAAVTPAQPRSRCTL